jgi:hypothetical protein
VILGIVCRKNTKANASITSLPMKCTATSL